MEAENCYIDVILPLGVRERFTYHLPDFLIQYKVEPGMRVLVQFGKKKQHAALVNRVHNKAPGIYQTKAILAILDEVPIVNSFQFKLWNWICDYYLCHLGDCFKAAVPSGFKIESESRLYVNELPDEGVALKARELNLVKELEVEPGISLSRLASRLNLKSGIYPLVKRLIERKIITADEELGSGVSAKTKDYYKLSVLYQEEQALGALLASIEKKAPKQYQALMGYLSLSEEIDPEGYHSVARPELLKKTGLSPAIYKALLNKEVFAVEKREITRLGVDPIKKKNIAVLSPDQEKALMEVKQAFDQDLPVLLHGITSSGKTEIYIHLIQEQVNKGKQVLYLLPEIALTTQIINRLRSVFGEKVGVYHSKFNDAERVEVWQNLLGKQVEGQEEFQVILGVRSSTLLPFSNLGLVIIDEEHETSYKQFDPAPRYNARDTALVLASMFKANVLLGSATPSLESYFNVKTGKYILVELFKRHLDLKLPQIELVNVKEARRKKQMQSHFSPKLISEVQTALDKKEQIILFQNRRGFSIFVECNDCAWIPQCKNCDVSLTYHKHFDKMVCHYCGYSEVNPKKCLNCGGEEIRPKGFGTEKVEDEIAQIFPEARIVRMDLDSTRRKKAFEQIIKGFSEGEMDILIGTQMVTKGLDFDNVSVVGILNADNMLNFPDFRSHERGFQLMAQVSGRAGRRNTQGKVIVQTSDPTNRVIHQVVENNYTLMFDEQIKERFEFHYPPVWRMIRLTLKHKDPKLLKRAAWDLTNELRHEIKSEVIGPQPPLISRIQALFQQCILIKIRKPNALEEKKRISEIIDRFRSVPGFKSVIIVPDVDPY